MSNKVKSFIQQNRKSLLFLGIILILAGIALAYFTGDAEPWGTIGGILSALGFFLALIAGTAKKE